MDAIQTIYIALFGRPADPLGLAYFAAETNNGADLTAIGDLAATAEYQNRFAGDDIATVITEIYNSLFNRNPESSGLAYYIAEYNAGRLNINNIAIAIAQSAQGIDVETLANKVAAANAFTAAIDTPDELAAYRGDAAAAQGRAYLEGVTSDDATIPTQAEVDQAVDNLDPNVGDTIVLTDGIDVGPEFTGGDLNDTFVGTIDTGNDTFNVGDDLDGGVGSDTLRLTSTGTTNAIDLSTADLTSIENVELRIRDENFTDLDLGSIADELETLSLDFGGGEQSADFEIEGISADTAVSISNIESDGSGIDVEVVLEEVDGNINGLLSLSNVDDLDVFVEVDDAADGSGDADVFTVNFANVSNSNGNASFYIDDVETLNINVASDSTLDSIGVYYNNDGSDFGPQTVNLSLNGDLTVEDFFDLSDDEEDATLNITGAGNLTIEEMDDGDSNLTINAEDATGNIDIQEASSGYTGLTVTYGSGNDRLTLESGFDMSVLTADGGEGTNILGVDADDAADIADADITNFQTLELTGAAGADVTVDADDNDFDNLIISADITNNLVVEDLSGDVTISADQSGTVTLTPEGSSDDLVITLDDEAGDITLAQLDVSEYTAIEFVTTSSDSDETDVTFTSLIADELDTLTFTGEGDVDIDALSSTDLGVLDLSGLTGTFDNNGAVLNANADVLIGNLGDNSYIDLDAGATQELTFGADLDETVNIDGFETGVGGDVLNLAALGVDSFADLDIVQTGADTTITSDAFEGEIVLVGVLTGDLDGTSNFTFA
ncbi:DUF4214 domain-containing protein [Tianweitania sediminis]|uniref:DUF4214 domain-containing protein n=1 Tax=Tianweitania sediminis TaxID=1502156 RepID=A0A8J7UNC6_9HYPH|nr:DUF4214 domain-containing protein [Tianweitania sediminis]MBP0441352.1 DUF4214 domain-containing protein [Tianweitania sediminis]